MPEFEADAIVDVDPDDFVRRCSPSEIARLKEILQNGIGKAIEGKSRVGEAIHGTPAIPYCRQLSDLINRPFTYGAITILSGHLNHDGVKLINELAEKL